MKPLIKWPGGKRSEFKYIDDMIPLNFNRYIEPFFGGGAIFFELKPKSSIINDLCKELIEFYEFVKNKDKAFEEELMKYASEWAKIEDYIKGFKDDLLKIYKKLDFSSYDEITRDITSFLNSKKKIINSLFAKDFCIDKLNLEHELIKNITAKLYRTKKIDENNNFSDAEVLRNIETGFRSGVYMHFRNIMNLSKFNKIIISDAKRISNWYFIREFCYASMFRFNKKGEFNIPYGGMGYNNKNFEEKVKNIFSIEVNNLFENTEINNLDFEKFFDKHSFNKTDFIFLDPPYDSEFSDYEENAFTKKDQERLAKQLYSTKAKFILIIKNTPFIKELYDKKTGIFIDSFDKKYAYNVRGRNERNVEHLIIHNLKEE